MPFTNSKYQADSGDIFKIRLDDDTLAVAGTPPTGAETTPLYVKVSKTNREFGLRPRLGVYVFVETAPSGRELKVYKRVPFLTPAAFAAAPNLITIGTEDYVLVSKQNEDY